MKQHFPDLFPSAQSSTRLILCFFPAEEPGLEEQVRALIQKHRSQVCFLGGGQPPKPFCQRYAPLRLDHEFLLALQVRPQEVLATVEALRGLSHLSMFVLREDFEGLELLPVRRDERERSPECLPVGPAPSTQLRESWQSRLRKTEQALDASHANLMEAAALGHTTTAAAAWFLDNLYLVRTNLADIKQALPRRRGRSSGPAHARICELARNLVKQSGHTVSEANIREGLREDQRTTSLRIEELWLFPVFLRLALIEELVVLACSTSRGQQQRELAFLWADRLVASARKGPDQLETMLTRMEAEPYALSPAFLASLAEQLQGDEEALARAQFWVETQMQQTLLAVVRTEHAHEAAESVATAQAFGSLRTLAHLDFNKIFEAVSLVDAELQQDPAAIYARSDFTTRDQCRREVERIARCSGMEEREVARLAVVLANGHPDPAKRHVTHYLLADGVVELERLAGGRASARTRFVRTLRRHATGVYLGSIAALTVSFTGITLAIAESAGVSQERVLGLLAFLALLPLSELAIQIVNALVISFLVPVTLPKMDFKEGIPPEHATLVIIPMMLSSVEGIHREIEKLEVRFLANPESNLFFGLFSDFTDSGDPTAADDAVLLQTVRRGIAGLNERYSGGRFVLFHRRRMWSESEQKWIGRERKRGKLDDLNAFLASGASPEVLHVGRLPLPIRYVITLDADTQLPPESAGRLIETIAHPLNRPEFDPQTGVCRKGYSIIQPRISISLPGATATRFTRIFADTAGLDPYCRPVSDSQQDLFCEGIFHGKAIYDVRSFQAALENRFPPETLLSHDLIEGAYAGVGLASDIELFENLPLDYASYSRRQQRWIRGDWQIAPWILPKVPGPRGSWVRNPLSIISRWRILDNLRRSLVPIASLLLLLLAWFISASPGVWTATVALAIAIPGMAPLLDRWARHLNGFVDGWQGAADEIIRASVMIAFLPHQAWLAMDAITRACYRSWVSRRHLLEWQTSDAAEAHASQHLRSVQTQVLTVASISGGLILILGLKGQLVPPAAFLGLWLASPLLLRWLNNSAPGLKQLSRSDTHYLRRAARRTWRYFDDLVGEENNWLPPDNSQMALQVKVAQRTSPTNIGLWLTSAIAAHDFGFLTADELSGRCSKTMETMERLERYEGHILNWYDTKTLEPLSPKYVSSVDSGNLIASLWTFAQGCQEIIRTPVASAASLRGMFDTLAILSEASGEDPFLTSSLHATRRLLRSGFRGHHLIGRLRLVFHSLSQLRGIEQWTTSPGDERAYWAGRLLHECSAWVDNIDKYLSWMETLARPPDAFVRALGEDMVSLRRQALHGIPSLKALASEIPPLEAILARRGTPEMRPEAAAWLEQISTRYLQARSRAAETVRALETLASRADALAGGTNMRFLYDENRRLFAVGYALGGPVDFTSHYDLLASESRLASLVSIAKRDVPLEHWFALGRPRGGSGRYETLLSWSGTMFEYLMPLLFTRVYANSLLDQASRRAVQRQIEYGREKQVPWGISESAYSALDDNRVYQYRAFGVPALALHPDIESEPVVAPYSTVLALMVDPGASLPNLKRLDGLGLAGPMGFYEAIDFSRAPKRGGLPGVVIYAYMAHHEGMSLLALNNTLFAGNMQRRFHQDPRIRAVEPLLFERVPTVKLQRGDLEVKPIPVRESPVEEPAERTWTEESQIPRAYVYGNGRYALMITNSGSGYSRWKDFELTRWRADTTLDDRGSYLYIRDLRLGAVWSAAHQPLTEAKRETTATFSADHVEFHRQFLDIETVWSITVAPDDDAELRRLVVTNHSRRTRQLEFTSYLELALAPHGADAAHPAFSKLFIETEYPEEGVLLARRRPRSPDEPSVWCAHVVTGAPGAIQFETDRRAFLGRSRTARSPRAMETDLDGSVGCVLDPIFSLRCSGSILPRTRMELAFATLAGDSREAVLALAAKYKRREAVARAFEMAWTHAQLEFRFLQIGPGAAHRYQELANHLIYPNSRLRPSAARLAQNHLGQSALWGLGISGDLPILTVTAADSSALRLVHDALAAHAYWRLRGFRADLVILNQEAAGYDRPLHHQLQRQIDAYSREAGTDRPGGVFLRDSYTVSEEHQRLILDASRAVLSGSRGSLERQLRGISENPRGEVFVPLGGGKEEPSAPLPFLELPYFNGLGGFTGDGREYAIYMGPGAVTPTPWVNVMANPRFGTLVSESGLGFTWRGNSQQNRLTSWRNDPVSDPPSEVIYLRDEESGARWTPTALPIREQDAYRARHSQGYTVFEHNSHAIAQELTVFVPIGEDGEGDPVKVCRLRLRNDSSRPRRLTATYFAELVLGTRREDQQAHIRTARDEESGALFASQNWTGQNPDCVAFAASSPKPTCFTGDRRAFLGRNRSFSNPQAMDNSALDNRASAGLDPACGLQVRISLDPGHEADVVFLLGEAGSAEEARAIISRYESIEQVYRALSATRYWWETKLLAVQVNTPLLSVDLLLNRWLPYQTLSCRFWGRSALYQSSGAFGFRDQLQDSMAFLYLDPEITRRHILAAAARQFFEGDVQHWWHSETGLGVRTRCSDDLLWLPYVVARYVEVTGDASVLDASVPFIEGPPLAEHEQERVFVPEVSAHSASLWDHCCLALDHAWRLGPHNLPLIGNGDWNDGMNYVGVEGRGESAWLAWFQCSVLESFARLAEQRARALAVEWRGRAANLTHTMEEVCWDGEWYLRGFFDDGSPLGSHLNQEARIDSLPQSWAVISGAADPHRARSAMEAADRNLVREEEKLVLLFTPPFDQSQPNPGYIMGYPPGVRENGGQYTHGSLWLAQAWARLGEGGNAVRLLNMMNPVELCRDPEAVQRYRGEPYVAPADVYSAPGKEGQCGWTWYTGSAGWMYRIWIEEVLGFQLRGTRLSIQPVIPAEWPGFEITYRYRSSTYRIVVEQGKTNNRSMELDGAAVNGDFIELADDRRRHDLVVRIPPKLEHLKLLGPGFKEASQANGLQPQSALKARVI